MGMAFASLDRMIFDDIIVSEWERPYELYKRKNHAAQVSAYELGTMRGSNCKLVMFYRSFWQRKNEELVSIGVDLKFQEILAHYQEIFESQRSLRSSVRQRFWDLSFGL